MWATVLKTLKGDASFLPSPSTSSPEARVDGEEAKERRERLREKWPA